MGVRDFDTHLASATGIMLRYAVGEYNLVAAVAILGSATSKTGAEAICIMIENLKQRLAAALM